MRNLMKECWHSDPSARHTALRLKKSLELLLPPHERSDFAVDVKTGFRNYSTSFASYSHT